MCNPTEFQNDLSAVAERGHKIPDDVRLGLIKWIGNPSNPLNVVLSEGEVLSPELAAYRAAMSEASSRSLKLGIARGLGALLTHRGLDMTMGQLRELSTLSGVPRLYAYQISVLERVFLPKEPAVPLSDDEMAALAESYATTVDIDEPHDGVWISYT